MLSSERHFVYEILPPKRLENKGHCSACIRGRWESVPGVPDHQFRPRINNTPRDDFPGSGHHPLLRELDFLSISERACFLCRGAFITSRQETQLPSPRSSPSIETSVPRVSPTVYSANSPVASLSDQRREARRSDEPRQKSDAKVERSKMPARLSTTIP